MPMSEHEEAQLRLIEAHLAADEPVLDRLMSGGRPSAARTGGVLTALLGVAVLVTGTATARPIVGVAGYIIMLAGVAVAWRFRAERISPG